MKKHCSKCMLDIEDVMGIWDCLICGSPLELGWKYTKINKKGKLVTKTFLYNSSFGTIKKAIENKYCWHCKKILKIDKDEIKKFGTFTCRNKNCKAINKVKI